MVYAIIYGFSQDDGSYYQGSIQYLQDWTNCTRQNVSDALKKLIDSHLIIKETDFPSNKYYVNKDYIKSHGCKESLYECKQTLQNNKYNNISNNISKDIDTKENSLEDTNTYIQNKEFQNSIDEIVRYMNSICGTHFKPSSASAKKHIKARLKEGYNFEDFKDVIDYKWQEWGKVPYKFSTGQMSDTYLRPSTLFSTNHFEEYLQAAWKMQFKEGTAVKSDERSNERSELKF